MVALLALRPMRRRNYASIKLGEHLIRQKDTWWLLFKSEEVKNHQAIEYPVPDALVPWVKRYLNEHRPLLLQGPNSDVLWISECGTAMTLNSVGQRVPKVMKRLLGIDLSCHLFSHCTTTTIANEDPAHALCLAPFSSIGAHR